MGPDGQGLKPWMGDGRGRGRGLMTLGAAYRDCAFDADSSLRACRLEVCQTPLSVWVAGAQGRRAARTLDVMKSFGSRSEIGAGSSFFSPTGCDAVLARCGRHPFFSSCPPCQNDNRVRRGMPFTVTLVRSSPSNDGISTSGMIKSEMAGLGLLRLLRSRVAPLHFPVLKLRFLLCIFLFPLRDLGGTASIQ